MLKKGGPILTVVYFVTVIGILAGVFWGTRTVTTLSEAKPFPRSHTFILDPGHGGVDGGATSCTGKLESAFNLEISLRLNDLMHFLGYKTRMIRTEDISIYTKGETIAQKKMSDLKERVRICAETEGAVLLSIHQNTFPDGRYSGAQVFYPKGEESKLLADKLQSAFVETLNPGSHRKPKKAEGIYLMEHIGCPGVLIECGFLSNVQEEGKLRSGEYQQQICCIIAAITATYFAQT